MIKCNNECPEKKHEGCCMECPHKDDCQSKCDSTPDSCGESTVEGTELEVFQNKAGSIIKAIADIVTQKKDLEEKEKTMKAQLQTAMEENNIKSFNNEVIKVTYVAPTTSTSIDSAKLKKKYPDIAAECSKTSSKAGYVKIEVK
jgi:hypothetical protein